MKLDEFVEIWGIKDENLERFAKILPKLKLMERELDKNYNEEMKLFELYENNIINREELENKLIELNKNF